MPSTILKVLSPDGGEPLYVEWSSVVDAIVQLGTREQMKNGLMEEAERMVEKRLDHAGEIDRKGGPVTHFTVMEGPGGQGTLEAEDMYEYAKAIYEDRESDAAKLVRPADWV